MIIKDIVNRDIVNLTNCEQEPIHIPGSIQPHGFLLAVHEHDLTIAYCSANVNELISITYEQCLGKKLEEVLAKSTQSLFLQHKARPSNVLNPPFAITINGAHLLCSIHKSGALYVAEFEPAGGAAPDITAVYDQNIGLVNAMAQSATLQDLCARVAEQTRQITGYDRVMIYRFDKEYNGEVFAESKAENIEPFLGLHYPHTDIPVQARQLYLTNLMRIIPDAGYTPVPIYTLDDGTNKNLDMSMSGLRSVSPIHIQYLHNMGVSGTFTISLLHEGKLWGLITCHHYSKKYVPLYTRIAAQLQGHLLTSQIDVRQKSEEYVAAKSINASLEKLLEEHYQLNASSFEHIVNQPTILSLCNAGGAAILFDGVVYKTTQTPQDEEIKLLANWLATYSPQGTYSTARLADTYPDAKKFSATGGGIIYHSLGGLQNDCIIWFAPETLEEVHWAGDPGNAILTTEKGLTPRNSFELWKQVVKYQSREWINPELLATASFAHALQKHIHLIFLSEEEKKQRKLTAQLQEANAELENINWISSHDLKEPLRKIQMFSSRILDKEQQALSKNVIDNLQKMNNSANRMQQLISDITAYSKVRLTHDTFTTVDLTGLMNKIKDEMADEIAEKNATVTCGHLPSVNGVAFLLQQLFINLLRNSLKFSKKDIAPQIDIVGIETPVSLIDMADNKLYHKITITDNGIGFEPQHNTSIFRVFSRLHTVAEFEGSGVGLALCKKIMQNHNGAIYAEGMPDIGAVFTLFFPVE